MIACLGLSHRTAPVALRERFQLSAEAMAAILPGLPEAVVLSTCNRLELYARLPDGAADPEAVLGEILAGVSGVPAAEFADAAYIYEEETAVRHLCRVAAGLDSAVLGEPQILGQVTQAAEAARRIGTLGRRLGGLFEAAVRAGRRARTETAIGRLALSVGSIALQLAEEELGSWRGRRVVVVGAGELARLVVKGLQRLDVDEVRILNRTPARAKALAKRWGGAWGDLSLLPEAVQAADVVFGVTGAPRPVITPALLAGRRRPLVLVDLAVPRDVDPAVAALPGVLVHDMDAVQAQAAAGLAGREREIPRVEAIIAAELEAWQRLEREAAVRPLLTGLRRQAEAIRARELDRSLRQLPGVDEATRRQLEHLSRSLVNQLLHAPTARLRAQALEEESDGYLAVAAHLFGVEPGRSAGDERS